MGGLPPGDGRDRRRPHRRNRILREEKEILTKAATWFAEDTGSTPAEAAAFVKAEPGQLFAAAHGQLQGCPPAATTGGRVGAPRPGTDRPDTSGPDRGHPPPVAGAPRIHAELRFAGVRVARKRVARLIRQAHIQGVHRRKRVFTTRRNPEWVAAPDLLRCRFTTDEPLPASRRSTPNFETTEQIVAHSQSYSPRCSNTSSRAISRLLCYDI